MSDSGYEVVVTRPAARALSGELPPAVAAAVVELIIGPLADRPHAVGSPLRRELDGLWAARRGSYRVIYRIVEERREVVIIRIDHRRDAYRRLD